MDATIITAWGTAVGGVIIAIGTLIGTIVQGQRTAGRVKELEGELTETNTELANTNARLEQEIEARRKAEVGYAACMSQVEMLKKALRRNGML